MKNFFIIVLSSLIATVSFGQNIPIRDDIFPVQTVIPGDITNHVVKPAPFSTDSRTKYNYVKLFEPQYPISSDASVNETYTPDYIKLNTTYTDGMGRILETIARYNTTNKDLTMAIDNRTSVNCHQYLPYPTSANNSSFKKNPFEKQEDYYLSLYPEEGKTAMSEELYQSTMTKKATFMFKPGKSNVGQSHGSRTGNFTNAIDEVIMWKIDPVSSWPQKIGYYNPNTLVKKVSESADGMAIWEYYDNENKLIAKNILVDYTNCNLADDNSSEASRVAFRGVMPKETPLPETGDPAKQPTGSFLKSAIPRKMFTPNTCPNFVLTYYVYDEYGRLIYTITPKGTQKLYLNGWIATSSIIENLCNYYVYDESNRVVETHTAGQTGNKQVVFDAHNRIACEMAPGQTNWCWNHYDRLDRVIESGTGGIPSISRSTLQQYFDNHSLPSSYNMSSNILYYLYNENQQGKYINVSTGATILSISFFDEYNVPSYFIGATAYPLAFGYDAGIFTGYTASGITAVAPPAIASPKVRGRLVYNVAKIIKPSSISGINDYVAAAKYYDDNGLMIETQRKNAFNGIDVFATQYDFKGRILRDISRANNPVCTSGDINTLIVRSYRYEPRTMRLKSIQESINGSTNRTLASYDEYDDVGRLSVKTIGGIEYQKFDYNIRGQLTGINKRFAESPFYEDIDDGHPITFGESIKYDAGFTRNYYCGNISGIIWKDKGHPCRAYGYTYDNSGRLKQADYREYYGYMTYTPEDGGEFNIDWNNRSTNYTEGNYNYDENGNLISLNRYGPTIDPVTSTIQLGLIDDLVYTYKAGGISNQIESIKDNIDLSATSNIKYDYKDNTASGEYTYDLAGNTVLDLDKDVSTSYDYLINKPVIKVLHDGSIIENVYALDGTKIREIYTDAGGTAKTKDYIGYLQFENNKLNKISNNEGYAVKNGSDFDYFFFVRDHLGNVRNLLNSVLEPVSVDYYASHETRNDPTETKMFGRIPLVRGDKPLSITVDDCMSANLDASDSTTTIGTTLMLKVMGGDRFEISAESYYNSEQTPTGTVDQQVLTSTLLQGLVSGPRLEGLDEAGKLSMAGNMTSAGNLDLLNLLDSAGVDTSAPMAFINYIQYDQNFNIVPQACGRIQVAAEGDKWRTIGTAAPIMIRDDGYLVVYLSTATMGTTVSFDNLTIKHYVGNIQDVNHYYPYGLTINLSTTYDPISPSPVNPLINNLLFQTKEYDKRGDLYVYDFGAREYNPQIGRFNSVDPMKQFSGSYTGMADNPVSATDPSGKFALLDDLIAMGVGGAINLGMAWADGNVQSWQDGFMYFTVGAVSGELGLVTLNPMMASAAAGVGNSIYTQARSKDGKSTDYSRVNPITVVNAGLSSALVTGGINWLTNGISDRMIRAAINEGTSSSPTINQPLLDNNEPTLDIKDATDVCPAELPPVADYTTEQTWTINQPATYGEKPISSLSDLMDAAEAKRYDAYWQRKAPTGYQQLNQGEMQGESWGYTGRYDWKRISDDGRVIEHSTVIYDETGHQIYRVDYTDHGMPWDHSAVHLHEIEWSNNYLETSKEVYHFWPSTYIKDAK